MIKKLFYLAVFLCAIFINAQDTLYVNTENLNLRSGAGAKYDVVSVLPQNSKVIQITTEGNWSEVQDEQGNSGYVNTKFLSNSSTRESGNSGSFGFWELLIFCVFLFVGYKILKFLGRFSPSGGSSSYSSSHKPLRTYQCSKCGTIVQSPKMPLMTSCPRGGTHRWSPLLY